MSLTQDLYASALVSTGRDAVLTAAELLASATWVLNRADQAHVTRDQDPYVPFTYGIHDSDPWGAHSPYTHADDGLKMIFKALAKIDGYTEDEAQYIADLARDTQMDMMTEPDPASRAYRYATEYIDAERSWLDQD